MKPFSLLKISAMLALGFGATLILAPSGRAQAEVSPDIYDVSPDTPPTAKAKTHAVRPKQPSVDKAQSNGVVVTLSPASAENSPASQRRALVAVQDKRKAASSNSQPR